MFGECHMHIFMNGTDYRRAVMEQREGKCETVVRRNLEAYRRHGVTFVRDGGDHYDASVMARRLAPEYGIDYRTPIYAIHKHGHYGGIVGHGFGDLVEYEALVRDAIAQGADFIKIIVSGIMDFNKAGVLTEDSLSSGEIREMVHIAHEEGMAVMAHANGAEAVRSAVLAGVDSLEHGNFMDRDCIQLLAEADTIYVPTVSTIYNLLGDNRFPEREVRELWYRQKDVIAACYEAGICLALGSDAGAYCVLHGQGIEDEYRAFCLSINESAKLKVHLMEGEQRIREKFRRK